MPWKGVAVSETRERLIEDWKLNYYSVTELAERFDITPKTAHKWIGRYEKDGERGYHEHSRRPHSCPWQTERAIVEELVATRQAHPHWGPRKLLNLMDEREPGRDLPGPSTAALILARHGFVGTSRRHRRAHPGCRQTLAQEPNDIWAADYKGQFRLKNGQYCFPLTVSDLRSRYVLAVDAHPEVSLERTQAQFRRLFEAYGLPKKIRRDNGVPFASNALARLSQLSVWWIKLGIYPELIEPGEPQQNGCTSGCTGRSSRRRRSRRRAAWERSRGGSTAFGRSSTETGRTRGWG
ncbi:MAG: helix-turn-helix domain-containing protein [Candidatus Methylomirabilaceae bacterium]